MRIFIGLSIVMIGSHVTAFMSLLGKIDSDPTLLGANHFQSMNTDVSIILTFQLSLNIINKHLLKVDSPDYGGFDSDGCEKVGGHMHQIGPLSKQN